MNPVRLPGSVKTLSRFVLGVFILTAIFGVFAGSPAQAEQFNGGFTFQYATSALTLPLRTPTYVLHTRASMVDVQGDAWSDMTGAFSINYGLMKNFEMELTTILYQDLNLSSIPAQNGERRTMNIPGNFYLRWKYGNMRLWKDWPLYFGIQGSAHLPLVGEAENNIWLEPYYGNNMSFAFNMLFSYVTNPDYPEDGFQINYNFGYLNNNDGPSLSSSTEAIKAFFGVYYPFSAKFSGTLESQGTYFLGYPLFMKNIYSIEEYGYVTPSVKYKFSPLIALTTGVDIRVYQKENMTSALLQPDDVDNYPAWRVTSKLSFTPVVNAIRTGGPMGGGYGATNRGNLYDWGGVAPGDLGSMEIELEKIREDRKKAEQQLEELKKKVEDK